jgi:uncharacterized LabA/DUF88 family protein
MPTEPLTKRTVAFFDGQNLFNAAKEAFGYWFPNYDPICLAAALCRQRSWTLQQVRFYTGIPAPNAGDARTQFWNAKLAQLGRRGAYTFTRPLRHGNEKGIDVRIALDVVSCVLERRCDVALVFSQDQDLGEASDEARKISMQQGRWVKVASAFPVSSVATNKRGINGTEWLRIDRALYDSCIDPRDYRPRP